MTEVVAKKAAGYSTELTLAGRAIAAHIDKADANLSKYQDHMDTAGAHLSKARETCKEQKVSFTKFLKDHNIGKTRAHQILAVADGTLSKEELLAKNAANQRAYQKKLKEKAKAAEEAKEAKKEGGKSKSPILDNAPLDIADFVDFIFHAMENKSPVNARKAIEDELIAICNTFNVPH